MSKLIAISALPYYAEDVSALARALTKQLGQREFAEHAPCHLPSRVPSHLEMLNVLARAIGHRNYQHLRASAIALQRMGRLAEMPHNAIDVDYAKIERLSQYFDPEGRLTKWPKKFSLQLPCIWVIWSQIPAREKMDEATINACIKSVHTFHDHAILRRELVNCGLVKRKLDCSDYERIERQPPRDVIALIRQIALRKLHRKK